VRDHAKTDQHVVAMNFHRKSVTSYSPIAQALCALSEDEKKKRSLLKNLTLPIQGCPQKKKVELYFDHTLNHTHSMK